MLSLLSDGLLVIYMKSFSDAGPVFKCTCDVSRYILTVSKRLNALERTVNLIGGTPESSREYISCTDEISTEKLAQLAHIL